MTTNESNVSATIAQQNQNNPTESLETATERTAALKGNTSSSKLLLSFVTGVFRGRWWERMDLKIAKGSSSCMEGSG